MLEGQLLVEKTAEQAYKEIDRQLSYARPTLEQRRDILRLVKQRVDNETAKAEAICAPIPWDEYAIAVPRFFGGTQGRWILDQRKYKDKIEDTLNEWAADDLEGEDHWTINLGRRKEQALQVVRQAEYEASAEWVEIFTDHIYPFPGLSFQCQVEFEILGNMSVLRASVVFILLRKTVGRVEADWNRETKAWKIYPGRRDGVNNVTVPGPEGKSSGTDSSA